MQCAGGCRRPSKDNDRHTSYAAVDVVCVRNALGGEAQPNVREPCNLGMLDASHSVSTISRTFLLYRVSVHRSPYPQTV
jgi:hypothetical protein